MARPRPTSPAETEAQDLSAIVVYFTAGARPVRVRDRLGYVSDPDPKVRYDEGLLLGVVEGAGSVHERLWRMPFALSWLDRQLRKYCLGGAFRRV